MKDVIQKICSRCSRGDKPLIDFLEANGIYDDINSLFSNEISIKEKCFCWLNDIKQRPLCLCGNQLTFLNFKRGYQKYCSKSCSSKYSADKSNKKRKETSIRKYGTEHPMQNFENKIKREKTNLERFGSISPLGNKGVQDKAKATMLERYGVENASLSSEINDKRILKNQEKFGGSSPFSSLEVKEKAKNTIFENWGVYSSLGSNIVQDKAKATMLERYGVENASLSSEINYRKWLTRKSNYLPIFKKILPIKKYTLLSSDSEILEDNNIRVMCDLCKQEKILQNLNTQRISCECRKHRSIYEEEITAWLKSSVNSSVMSNDRSLIHPLELDIYIPDYNLAIEFDGLYWHCELEKEKNYHLQKTLACQEKDIQLIHIFENEWKDEIKQNIIKSIIKAKLGMFDERIYARKCSLKLLAQQEYNEFLDINHLQGSCISKVRLGLYHNDELISVMGFGKSRFKKDETELIRFANKLNTSIIGGFSKLLKYYIVNYKPDNLVSYCDLRYFDGSGYLKNGFEVIHRSDVNYFYWEYNTLNLYSRIQFQKHKLKDKLDIYDENLSEHENMLNNRYYRIYDCGNLKLKFRNNI